MRHSEIVKILEELVDTPDYGVLGALGDGVAYFSTRGGVINISLLDAHGNTRRLTNRPVALTARPKKTLNHVVFAHDVEKGREIHEVCSVDSKGEETVLSSPKMRVTSIAFDSKTVAFTGSTQNETALFVVEDGSKLRKVCPTPPFTFVSDIYGERIVGSGALKGDPRTFQLFLAGLDGSFEVYTPKEASVNVDPKISGDKVYFVSDYENPGESYWVYSLDPASKSVERVEFSGRDIYDYGPVELSLLDDEQPMLVLGGRDGETRLFLDGHSVTNLGGTVNGAARLGDTVFFSHSSLTSPPKIYRLRPGGSPEVVVDNREWVLGEVSYVKLKTDVSVPTWVVKSAKSQVPGPTIVYVHGGPWSEVSNSWNLLIAPLLLSGYHVVAPNFRGSTGYGAKYMFLDIGDPGGGDLRDVVAAAQHAKDSGLASNVGVMGYSYGGFTTLLALGRHPEVWSFGVAGAAVADWEEMYGLSDSTYRGFIEMLFAGKNVELMKERSPITYASAVKVPLCIIHSQNDSRTPLRPVLRYVERLQSSGASFELHVVPNMGHAIYTMNDAVDVVLPALFFLKRLELTSSQKTNT